MSEMLNPDLLSPGGPRWWHWLFSPFQYVAGGAALLWGLVAMALSGWLAWRGGNVFDGVINFHARPLPLSTSLLACGIDWLCAALALFVIGKLISRTSFRALDLFATQALARWPLLLAAAAALAPGFTRATGAIVTLALGGKPHLTSGDLAVFVAVSLVMIVAFIWAVALMYQSFRTCCNVRGVSAVVGFVAGLLIAQVLSLAALNAVGVPVLSAKSAAVATAPSAALDEKANHFVDLLATGKYDQAEQSFAPVMKGALPAGQLKSTWENLVTQYGAFTGRVGDRSEAQAGYQIVYVTCQFAKQKLDVKVVFDKSQQISGLWFQPAT